MNGIERFMHTYFFLVLYSAYDISAEYIKEFKSMNYEKWWNYMLLMLLLCAHGSQWVVGVFDFLVHAFTHV